ncbi:MAG TPA: AvrE-family type 3 secretion system effector [Burkholderiaceae bacterium]|nr:AvrE-family type 3 secretion system effector [Burkholderiaceae bacterium]
MHGPLPWFDAPEELPDEWFDAEPGPQAQTGAARLAPSEGPPAVAVTVSQAPGALHTRVRTKGLGRKLGKVFARDVLAKGGVTAAAPPQPLGPDAQVQYLRTRDGSAVRIGIEPDGISAVTSQEPVYAPQVPRKSWPYKLMAPLRAVLPHSRKLLQTRPGDVRPGLDGVPGHLVSGAATALDGTRYGLGPDGQLYRFDRDARTWRPAEAPPQAQAGPAWRYTGLGPQPDGHLYAVRASAHGSELVRLDPQAPAAGEAEVVCRQAGALAAHAVTDDGRVLLLGTHNQLTQMAGERALRQTLEFTTADGQPLPEGADVRAVALGLADGGREYVAGDDGQLYRLQPPDIPGSGRRVAQRVETAFSDPAGAAFGTLLDLGHTLDPDTGAARLHAIYRKPSGEVFSAYHQDGGFRPGWRFDNAFMLQQPRGEPLALDGAVQVTRDGVQLALKEGVAHIGQAGGRWQPTSAAGLQSIKANPLGLEKTYGLQAVPQPDGSELRRVVRLDLQRLHPQVPAGSSTPQLGRVAEAADVALTELAAGRIRDFAVLESLALSDGDKTRRLYHVDDGNRLFTRDLNDAAPAAPVAVADQGPIRRIALDRSGDLYALIGPSDGAVGLHRLDTAANGGPAWRRLDVPLAPGQELADLHSTWTGRLHLDVRAAVPSQSEDGTGPPTRTYLYDPKAGLAPLDRRSAVDAMRAAGGREFHVPGLPAAHVHHEWLGFKSTSRPFLSATVNWAKSSWAHARSLAGAPKVAARWLQHQRHGRKGLQPLYQSTARAADYFHVHLAQGAPHRAASSSQWQGWLAEVQRRDPQLADRMQGFRDDLMRSSRQMLQHIGYAAGFLDANLAAVPDFKGKPPASFDRDRDLVADLQRWFTRAAKGAAPDPQSTDLQQCVAALEQMSRGARRDGSGRMYLHYPQAPGGDGRQVADGQGLFNARLIRNIQALDELHELARQAAAGAPADVQQVEARLRAEPLTQLTDLSFGNLERLEETYDIFRTMGRAFTNWRHPMNRTLAESLDVQSPSRRKAALLKALDTLQKDPQSAAVDRNLLAAYGMPDPAELRRALMDKRHPEHGRLKQQLQTQSEEDLKSRFAETMLSMKTKETQSTERSYGVGLDPLSYFHNVVGAFAGIGGMLGRGYTLYVEALGDDPRGGDLAIMIEKSRDASAEVFAGWGKSAGREHDHGVLHHFIRAALIGELGVRHTHAGGMYFLVPRDQIKGFADRLFDFGRKGGSDPRDLAALMRPHYERETLVRKETALDGKLLAFLRMGPSGYNEKPAGHFWGARANVFQATVGVGRESTTYQIHGQRLDGELQVGAERHQYLSQEASMLVGLPLRNWFNFPTDAEAPQQFALGVGNLDNGITLGLHNKDGAKCEYRMAMAEPIQSGQWELLRGEVAAAFPQHRAFLDSLAGWAGSPESLGPNLARLEEVIRDDWKGQVPVGQVQQLLGNLQMMRWQQGLALARKPMYFGMIHEVRAANPSRLTQPGLWQSLAEKTYGAAAAASDPLRKMHAQMEADPALKRLLKDLQATHPTRIKFKYEITPQAMEALVRMQLENPNLDESRIAAFMRDPANFRINTIAALKSNSVSNGASVWPVVGASSGSATMLEEQVGSIHFHYDEQGRHVASLLDGGFAQQRRSVQQPRRAFEQALGHEPVVLPARYSRPPEPG